MTELLKISEAVAIIGREVSELRRENSEIKALLQLLLQSAKPTGKSDMEIEADYLASLSPIERKRRLKEMRDKKPIISVDRDC